MLQKLKRNKTAEKIGRFFVRQNSFAWGFLDSFHTVINPTSQKM
jgi:hypothetical protein